MTTDEKMDEMIRRIKELSKVNYYHLIFDGPTGDSLCRLLDELIDLSEGE